MSTNSSISYPPLTQQLFQKCLEGNCTNFEIMAVNDCTFIGGPFWQGHVAPWLRTGINWFGYASIIISGLTGLLILSKKENRERYPHKFIGLICLAQSSTVFTLNSFDKNFCEQPEVPFIKNMMIAPGSWISERVFGGWYLFNVTDLNIVGWMSMYYVIFYHTSLYTEMLISVCLNFDVVSTIRYPFSRNENLKINLFLMQIGFFLILVQSGMALHDVI